MNWKLKGSKLLLLLLLPSGICAQGMSRPESVVYHAKTKSYYTSSLDSLYICRFRPEMHVRAYPTPASSLGVKIHKGILYTAIDFDTKEDEIKGYSLRSGKEVFSLTIPGSQQLNDIEVDGRGHLFVSDRLDHIVYQIDIRQKTYSQLIRKNEIDTPNGLYYDLKNDRLLICNTVRRGAVYSYSFATKTLSTMLKTPFSNLDGITMDPEGNIYFTSWSEDWSRSALIRMNSRLETDIILENLHGMADISFSAELQSLLIANIYTHNFTRLPLINPE